MANVFVDERALVEGERPMFQASWGKLMMWFFLVSDAFTFSAFLITYGALRVRSVAEPGAQAWADPEKVFTHTPGLYEIFHIEAPLVFVGIMTFILILSSVTMVLAVEAGHRRAKEEVAKWTFYTILGGAAFLSCQAYEWYHFIHGFEDQGVVIPAEVLEPLSTKYADGGEYTALFVNGNDGELLGFRIKEDGRLIQRTEIVNQIKTLADQKNTHSEYLHRTTGGANLKANEYGPQAFADLFFFVTGFHGTHVLSGVVLLIILYLNVRKGTYEKRGHYEMVEKIGLYWHFVDLVWVFVFTFFYLV